MKSYRVFLSTVCIVVSIMLLSKIGFSEEKGQKETARLFSISQIVVAEDIREREPIGIADSFPLDVDRVYVYIEATDITEDTDITVNWYHEGEKVHSYTLPLTEGTRWRTYAYKNIFRREGNWEIKLIDENGDEVESVTFEVK